MSLRPDLMNDPRLLRLHESDNVLTAILPLSVGDTVSLDGEECPVATNIAVGHKLAVRDIVVGEKVIKYGAPIGSATRAIRRGEHVHTHNLQSDYLPGGEGEGC